MCLYSAALKHLLFWFVLLWFVLLCFILLPTITTSAWSQGFAEELSPVTHMEAGIIFGVFFTA